MHKWVLVVLLLICISSAAEAGPPFFTDDPEPVDFRHWEFYLASAQVYQRGMTDMTLPHVEVNYGALPNLQLHVITPMEYLHDETGVHYGYSNTEFGIKYRLLDESESLPQIGIFPLVEVPTGNTSQGLGTTAAQVFLPVWIQKSFGKFTTYGGGGYWMDFNPGAENWFFAGWEGQYEFSDALTLGAEVYYQSPHQPLLETSSGFSVGGFWNFSDHDHLLFSVGHTISGEASTTAYVAYQYTI